MVYSVVLVKVYSKMNLLYIHIYPLFFRSFSHIGYYRILSIVPYAIQWVLISYLFICRSVYMSILISQFSSPSLPPLLTTEVFPTSTA